jgi:hypothetical protein
MNMEWMKQNCGSNMKFCRPALTLLFLCRALTCYASAQSIPSAQYSSHLLYISDNCGKGHRPQDFVGDAEHSEKKRNDVKRWQQVSVPHQHQRCDHPPSKLHKTALMFACDSME